jgi:hypothetical protein
LLKLVGLNQPWLIGKRSSASEFVTLPKIAPPIAPPAALTPTVAKFTVPVRVACASRAVLGIDGATVYDFAEFGRVALGSSIHWQKSSLIINRPSPCQAPPLLSC